MQMSCLPMRRLLALALIVTTNISAAELLRESFDSEELPALFTVGKGKWEIVDGALRGQQLAADNHTAFRKIYLDHQHVRYAYDMKLTGEAFHQLLINWGLAHIAKVVIRYEEASVWKIKEANKKLSGVISNLIEYSRGNIKGNDIKDIITSAHSEAGSVINMATKKLPM